MVSYIKTKLASLDIHTVEVVRKSSASMLVRIGGMGSAFIVSIILGRTVGPEGLGIINLANQITAIILIIAMLGMNNVILKEVAIAFERKDWQHVSNVIFTSFRINLPFGLGLNVLFILLAPWLSKNFFHEPSLEIPLIIALTVIVPQILSRIFAAGVNGFRKIWQSNLVNETLSSAVVFLGLIILLLAKVEITIIKVAILYAISRVTVTISIGKYWRKIFRYDGPRSLQSRSMLKVALPLLLVSASTMIASNADTVMLGWLSNAREVGFYSVAARLGLLTSFFHLLTASALSPKIAALWGERKVGELQTMVQRVTLGLCFIGLISVIIFIFEGQFLLKLWGNEFSKAYWPLLIISFGQFFNIATGATGVILIMSGHEKIVGYITMTSAVINLLLNYFLIPKWGALGAATATAATVIIENFSKVIIVKRRTKITTVPFIK